MLKKTIGVRSVLVIPIIDEKEKVEGVMYVNT